MNKLNITTLRRILIIIVSFCSGFIQTYAGSSEKEITMIFGAVLPAAFSV